MYRLGRRGYGTANVKSVKFYAKWPIIKWKLRKVTSKALLNAFCMTDSTIIVLLDLVLAADYEVGYISLVMFIFEYNEAGEMLLLAFKISPLEIWKGRFRTLLF